MDNKFSTNLDQIAADHRSDEIKAFLIIGLPCFVTIAVLIARSVGGF